MLLTLWARDMLCHWPAKFITDPTHMSDGLDDWSTHRLLAVTEPVLPDHLVELPSFWPKEQYPLVLRKAQKPWNRQ